jgi:hypothetical protein
VPALKELAGSAGSQSITPESASRISPEQVQQIANQAQRASPSIIDQVSGYYARHPDVVKALGGAAITLAIQRIVQRR